MYFLKLLFHDEGRLYANCSFDILTIYRKCYRFYFFIRGIRMYISILTEVPNGHISGLKDNAFLLRIVPFEASFL